MAKQRTFFDHEIEADERAKRGVFNSHVPPHQSADTSRDSAKQLAPHVGRLGQEVFQFISGCGDFGATCDEIELRRGMRHQTASSRVRALVKAGLVLDSGRRRITRSGRPAIVWVIRKYKPAAEK